MFDAKNALSRELQAILDQIVNPQWGLISRLEAKTYFPLGLSVVHTALSSPAYFRSNIASLGPAADSGTGAGFSIEQAHWSAIGEAIERYCASIYSRHLLPMQTATGIGDAIDLTPLIRAGPPSILPFEPALARRWVRAVRLRDGAPCYVPAQMAYLAYEPEGAHDILCQSDSTGLAAGQSWEDACLRALCERLERDAFAANWLLARQPPLICLTTKDLQRLSPGTARALGGNAGFFIRLFHLASIFGVHVIMACLTTSDGVGLVAAAASPDLMIAMEKATVECLQGSVAARRLFDRPRPATIADLKSTIDHALYYLDPKRFQHVSKICAGNDQLCVAHIEAGYEKPAKLAEIVKAAALEGFGPVAVDLTTQDVQAIGFHVVRVIVPGLQPLIFGQACMDVSDPRRLAQWQGIWQLPTARFNPHPHPFP